MRWRLPDSARSLKLRIAVLLFAGVVLMLSGWFGWPWAWPGA